MESSNQLIHLRSHNGRKGMVMHRDQYKVIENFIIDLIKSSQEVTILEILEEGQKQLSTFDSEARASLLITVKHHLQAEGLICITPRKKGAPLISLPIKNKPIISLAGNYVLNR